MTALGDEQFADFAQSHVLPSDDVEDKFLLESLRNYERDDVLDAVLSAHDQPELASESADLHGRNDIVEFGFARNLTVTGRGVRRPNGCVIFEKHR